MPCDANKVIMHPSNNDHWVQRNHQLRKDSKHWDHRRRKEIDEASNIGTRFIVAIVAALGAHARAALSEDWVIRGQRASQLLESLAERPLDLMHGG